MSAKSLDPAHAALELIDRSLSVDERLMLLSNPYRRSVLGLLEGTSGPVALEDLAERVASDVDDGQYTDVRISLHHNHLPKLDSHGVVDYDQTARTVVGR